MLLVLQKKTLPANTGSGELWAGDMCDQAGDADARAERCEQLATFQGASFTSDAELEFVVEANQIMFPNVDGACGEKEKRVKVWALIDSEGDATTYESISTKEYDVDTLPPPGVSDFRVDGGEDAVVASWTVSPDRAGEIWYYQAVCAVGDKPMLTKPSNDPLFVQTCGGTSDPLLAKQFICGESTAASRMSIKVPKEVQDMLGPTGEITVKLVVIDKNHNFVTAGPDGARPVPATDFWEVYEDQGGQAEGGYCFVATAAYGDYDHPYVLVLRDLRDHTLARFGAGRAFIAWYYRSSPALADFIREHAAARLVARVLLWPVVVLAGAWEYTSKFDKLLLLGLVTFALVRRRRRKQRRAGVEARSEMQTQSLPAPVRTRGRRVLAGAIAALVLLVGGARVASAQAVFDDELDLDAETRTPLSQWVFELKFGLYQPDVDSEFSGPGPGPYERTFGDDDDGDAHALISMVEVDRFFLFPGGQLGAYAAVGFTQKYRHAFAENANGTPDYTTRSPTDKTTFKLVPLYLGAVYRFTDLADRTVIPLVPYAKLGLAYDLWWVTKGNGGVSSTEAKGDAQGGTLGWQGALGLSFRADAIDPGAARNMQTEMGVEHVGFFAEITYADVSGFGEARKLHVGDLAWAAGVNFEF